MFESDEARKEYGRRRELLMQFFRNVKASGGRAYFTGGYVRDRYFLGESFTTIVKQDIDIEVFGLTPEKLEVLLSRSHLPASLVGRSFGVYKLTGDVNIDISLPRAEVKTGSGHRGFDIEVNPDLPLERAALRRDFTINAIYVDPLAEIDSFIDPYGGIKDAQNRVLRAVSDAVTEDPLRVLRGAQFAARFELTLDRKTAYLLTCCVPEMAYLARERVWEEWKKLLLKGVDIGSGLDVLLVTGALEEYYPELYALVGAWQEPTHHPEGDVYTHTKHCLNASGRDRTGNEEEDLVVGLAVLCHDLGKAVPGEKEGTPERHHGHHKRGVAPTRRFLNRLTRENGIADQVAALVETHMYPGWFFRSAAKASAFRRLATRTRLSLLARVAKADSCGRPPLEPDLEYIDWFLCRAENLTVLDRGPKEIVMGRHLIESFSLKPGPVFGKILAAAYEAQLDGEFDDLEGGLAFVGELLKTEDYKDVFAS